jgi:hypothetical protein
MRKVLLCSLVLFMSVGCKKAMDNLSADSQIRPDEKPKTTAQVLTAQQGAGQQPAVHGATGVVINPGTPGGSGGAVQSVRRAVTRSVNEMDMRTIAQFIEADFTLNGQMPSKEAIVQTLKRDAVKIFKLVEENVIVLTGTKNREHVWAYTYNAQTAEGEHVIIRSAGVERMPGQELLKLLQEQKGR